jgi:hypothetical protein
MRGSEKMANYADIAEAEVRRLNSEIARLEEMRGAWETIARNSEPQGAPAVKPAEAVAVFKTQKEAIVAAKKIGHNTAFGWQIDAVRDIFRSDPLRGFEPGEIWIIAQAKGISNNKTFVYSTLARLVKQGSLVRRERGKYYATAALLSKRLEAEKGSTEVPPLSVQ